MMASAGRALLCGCWGARSMCKMELREQQNDSHACFVGDSSTFSEEQQGQEQQQLAENRQQQTQNRNAKKCQVLQQMRHQQHCRPHSLEKPTAIACGCPDEAISTTYCTSLANTCCAICTTAQEAAKRLLKVKTWLKRMVAKSGKKFNAWTAASETRIQSRATNCLSCGSLDDDDCSNSRSVWLAAQDSSTCCDAAVIFTNSWTSESFKLQGSAPPSILELMNRSFVSGLLTSRQLRASTDPTVDEAGDAGQRLVDTADASESHKMLGADGALMWVMERQRLEQQPALPQLLMQEEVVKPGLTCVELSKQVVMPHDGCVTVNISGKAGSASKVPAVQQLWLPSATQAGLPDAGRPQYTQPLVSCNAAISTVLNHPTGGKAALLAALGASSTQSLGAGSSGKVRLAYLTIPSSPESSPLAAAEVEPSQILMPVVVKTVEHQVACAQDGTLSFDSALVDKELHYAQLATGSPNFPALLGCAREDDRSHLVFECMSQHTLNLAKWLRSLDDQNIKCLGRDVILSIARTTAAACEHLHQQAVLHNDIKPENIVIKLGEHGAAMRSTGQAVIAGSYVVDVGGCVPEGSSLQTFGQLTGTVEFQHPQLLAHAEDLDCCYLRCHEYASLGFVILYMLVMGRQSHYMQLRQLVHDAFDSCRKGSKLQHAIKLRQLRQAMLQLPGDGPVGCDSCNRVSEGLVDLVISLVGTPEDQPSSYPELQQLLHCAAQY